MMMFTSMVWHGMDSLSVRCAFMDKWSTSQETGPSCSCSGSHSFPAEWGPENTTLPQSTAPCSCGIGQLLMPALQARRLRVTCPRCTSQNVKKRLVTRSQRGSRSARSGCGSLAEVAHAHGQETANGGMLLRAEGTTCWTALAPGHQRSPPRWRLKPPEIPLALPHEAYSAPRLKHMSS